MSAVYLVEYPYHPSYKLLGCYEDFDDAVDRTRDPEIVQRYGKNIWITELAVQRGDQPPYRRVLFGPGFEMVRVDLEAGS